VAVSFSTWEPWVSQLPNVISEILKPELPRYLNSIFTDALSLVREVGRVAATRALTTSFHERTLCR
jgi:hypothetical protein